MSWRSWLLGLASMVAALAFLEILLPETKVRSTAKLVFGLVLLLAVLEPAAALLGMSFSGSLWEEDLLQNPTHDSTASMEWAEQLHLRGLEPLKAAIPSPDEDMPEQNKTISPIQPVQLTIVVPSDAVRGGSAPCSR